MSNKTSSAGERMKATSFREGDRVESFAGHVGTIVSILNTKPRQYRVKWDRSGNVRTVSPLNLRLFSSSAKVNHE